MFEKTNNATELGQYSSWKDKRNVTRVAKSTSKKTKSDRAMAERYQRQGITHQRPSNPYLSVEAPMGPPSVRRSLSVASGSDISDITSSQSQSQSSRSRSRSKQPQNHQLIELEIKNQSLIERLAVLKAQKEIEQLEREVELLSK